MNWGGTAAQGICWRHFLVSTGWWLGWKAEPERERGVFKSPVNVYPTLFLCFSMFVMERRVVGSGMTLMSGKRKMADESNTLVVDRCLKIMSA